ncbi:hypothetical protein CH379_005255 [Leptospira ellisii]|uniref:Uncharacterized protein n=1 Tax=Leptospira ellisii TaxID=2023197 RepID=A0AAE4QM05_9LEPT|nr:hypothetical protein [Leptospira ellisii]MDV6235035.1 hypothetical protein [Leptospira ellisii]
MFRNNFRKLQVRWERIWNVNLRPIFQSKRALWKRKRKSLFQEEFRIETIVQPQRIGKVIQDAAHLHKGKLPANFETSLRLQTEMESFAGGKKKLNVAEILSPPFPQNIRYLFWKRIRHFLWTWEELPWKRWFTRSKPETETSPSSFSLASPKPYRIYLHSFCTGEERMPFADWKEILPSAWIPQGPPGKITIRWIAAKAVSFSKQEVYEESYSPPLAFCDLYTSGYWRETSEKSVNLQRPQFYYLGTVLPEGLDRKGLPDWLSERIVLGETFRWSSSPNEQKIKLFGRELNWKIESEWDGPFSSDFFETGQNRFRLHIPSSDRKAFFASRTIYTYHPSRLASRIFENFLEL